MEGWSCDRDHVGRDSLSQVGRTDAGELDVHGREDRAGMGGKFAYWWESNRSGKGPGAGYAALPDAGRTE